MRDEVAIVAWIALSVLLMIGGWAFLDSLEALRTPLRILAYVVASLIVSFDMIDLAVRLIVRRRHGAGRARGASIDLGLPQLSAAARTPRLRPYAIVASIHNASDDIDDFMAAMAPFRESIWLIDDASTDDTLLRVRMAGWRCVEGGANRKKPAAIMALLDCLPPEIETVLIIDPDLVPVTDGETALHELEAVIFDFQRSGAAAMVPHFVVREDGWLVSCQALEYEFCQTLGRKSLADYSTTAGASLYRRERLEEVLKRHSLSVYAEDFENSVLLLAAGERIYYDDRLTMRTEGKRNLREWFSQRVGWGFGWAKVYAERARQLSAIAARGPMAAYQYVVYLGLLGFLLLPIKLLGLLVLGASLLNGLDALFGLHAIPDVFLNEPAFFATVYVKSLVVVVFAGAVALPRREFLKRLATIPLYVFYALLTLVPTSIGVLNLLLVRMGRRRLFTDHYDAAPTLLSQEKTNLALN